MITPTPVPTLPISIYPETWGKANEYLHQAFGIGFSEIAIGFALLIGIASAFLFVVKKLRES